MKEQLYSQEIFLATQITELSYVSFTKVRLQLHHFHQFHQLHLLQDSQEDSEPHKQYRPNASQYRSPGRVDFKLLPHADQTDVENQDDDRQESFKDEDASQRSGPQGLPENDTSPDVGPGKRAAPPVDLADVLSSRARQSCGHH